MAYSLLGELRDTTLGKFLDVREYWKQRRLVLSEPRLTLDDPDRRLTISPLAFALRSLVLLSVVFSLSLWGLKTFGQLPPTPLERVIQSAKRAEQEIEAAKYAQKHGIPVFAYSFGPTARELERVAKVQELGTSLRPVLIAVALTLTSLLFGFLMRLYKQFDMAATQAERAYLYYVSAWLLFPNLAVALSAQVLELLARYQAWEPYNLSMAQLGTTNLIGLWGLIWLRRAAKSLAYLLLPSVDARIAWRVIANRLAVSALVINLVFVAALLLALRGYSYYLEAHGQ